MPNRKAKERKQEKAHKHEEIKRWKRQQKLKNKDFNEAVDQLINHNKQIKYIDETIQGLTYSEKCLITRKWRKDVENEQ